MLRRQGFTLIEIIVVLIIIGAMLAFCLPNFTHPNEQALAKNATNNLLAIYSAEQNYYNNHSNSFCFSGGICNSLSDINTRLSLNIQDDGSFSYVCDTFYGLRPNCYATRQSTSAVPVITVWLQAPISIQYPMSTFGSNPYCGSLPSSSCPT